jgi:hypothetical protein
MTSRAIALLAFKLLGLLAVLVAIGPGAKVLPTMLVSWPYDSEGGSLLLLLASLLAPIALPLVLGGALWFGADALARKLFAASDAAAPPPTLEALQDLAFSIVGVFVLGVAIPDLAKLAYYYWQLSTPGGVQIGSDIERRGALIETVAQLVIGFWLLFGSSGIANLLRKVRGR